MFRKFICFLGFHNYTYEISPFESEARSEVISMSYECSPTYRTCKCCGKKQVKDIHCLGLNPPAYVDSWLNV